MCFISPHEVNCAVVGDCPLHPTIHPLYPLPPALGVTGVLSSSRSSNNISFFRALGDGWCLAFLKALEIIARSQSHEGHRVPARKPLGGRADAGREWTKWDEVVIFSGAPTAKGGWDREHSARQRLSNVAQMKRLRSRWGGRSTPPPSACWLPCWIGGGSTNPDLSSFIFFVGSFGDICLRFERPQQAS